MCEKEFCDFIVWTEVDFHAERISIDNEFCNNIVKKARSFFINAILPELVGKLFSRPSVETVTANSCARVMNSLSLSTSTPTNSAQSDNLSCESSDLVICICQTVYKPDKDDVIGCDNENCPYIWLHFKCAKIKRVPKGKWYCPSCRKLSQFRK